MSWSCGTRDLACTCRPCVCVAVQETSQWKRRARVARYARLMRRYIRGGASSGCGTDWTGQDRTGQSRGKVTCSARSAAAAPAPLPFSGRYRAEWTWVCKSRLGSTKCYQVMAWMVICLWIIPALSNRALLSRFAANNHRRMNPYGETPRSSTL
jgi:hypothetical protein